MTDEKSSRMKTPAGVTSSSTPFPDVSSAAALQQIALGNSDRCAVFLQLMHRAKLIYDKALGVRASTTAALEAPHAGVATVAKVHGLLLIIHMEPPVAFLEVFSGTGGQKARRAVSLNDGGPQDHRRMRIVYRIPYREPVKTKRT